MLSKVDTHALIVPNKEQLTRKVKQQDLSLDTEEGKRVALKGDVVGAYFGLCGLKNIKDYVLY